MLVVPAAQNNGKEQKQSILYSEDDFLLSTSSQRHGKEEDLDLYFIPVPLVSTSKDAGRQNNCSSGS